MQKRNRSSPKVFYGRKPKVFPRMPMYSLKTSLKTSLGPLETLNSRAIRKSFLGCKIDTQPFISCGSFHTIINPEEVCIQTVPAPNIAFCNTIFPFNPVPISQTGRKIFRHQPLQQCRPYLQLFFNPTLICSDFR